MAMKGRSILAVAVFLMLGAVVAFGSWYETHRVKRPPPAAERLSWRTQSRMQRTP